MINILYFARIAELTNKRNEAFELEDSITIEALITQLKQKYPDLNTLKTLKVAHNQSHVFDKNTLINNGDEIAIFEPVTGG